jgi:hypothetical protein
MIEVKRKDGQEFMVRLEEEGTSRAYNVTLDEGYYQELTGGKITKEELIKKSFEFLLEREPKESILSKFNLRVISRYFPEFEEKIKNKI